MPAVFSKLPPSVASFMLPCANEALLIGEGLIEGVCPSATRWLHLLQVSPLLSPSFSLNVKFS